MDSSTVTQTNPPAPVRDATGELLKQLAAGNRRIRDVVDSNLPKEIMEQIVLKGIGQVYPYRDCPCGSGKKFKFCCYRRS